MMKKIFTHKLITYFIILVLILSYISFGNFAQAYTSTSGSLKVEFAGDPPLFSEKNWKPGNEVKRQVTVTNLSSTNSQDLGIVASEKVITPANGGVNLAPALNIIVKENDLILYEDKLANLFKEGEVYLTKLAPQGFIVLDVVIAMDEDIGNEYQGLACEFDFTIGFTEVSAPVVSPVVFPPLGPAALGIAPIGRVLGVAIGPSALEEAPEEVREPEVKGVEEEKPEEVKEEKKVLCFWWWTLLLIMLAVLIGYYYYIRKEYISWWFVPPFVIAGFTYLLHEYLHKFYTPIALCSWFWLGDLIILALTIAYYYYFLRRRQERLW
jgi:hypothetical protein